MESPQVNEFGMVLQGSITCFIAVPRRGHEQMLVEEVECDIYAGSNLQHYWPKGKQHPFDYGGFHPDSGSEDVLAYFCDHYAGWSSTREGAETLLKAWSEMERKTTEYAHEIYTPYLIEYRDWLIEAANTLTAHIKNPLRSCIPAREAIDRVRDPKQGITEHLIRMQPHRKPNRFKAERG